MTDMCSLMEAGLRVLLVSSNKKSTCSSPITLVCGTVLDGKKVPLAQSDFLLLSLCTGTCLTTWRFGRPLFSVSIGADSTAL